MGLSLFNIEGEHPRSVKAIARRFVLWFLVCWISGGPSFAFAVMTGTDPGGTGPRSDQFDPWAMALGIMLFSIGYTWLTSTDSFDRFQRLPGVRRTLYIGYFTRLGVSIAFPVAMVMDMFPGIISVGISQALFNDNPFLLTLAATCIQGFILNGIISIYMLIVYAIVRAFTKGQEPRGFEVIPIAQPGPAPSAPQSPSEMP